MTEAAPPTRLTDRKRDAIVQAAIAEFREHGFNGTSMDRVAAAAEVSKRTVYNHFPSKDELFEAILEQLWERGHSLADVTYDARCPLRAQLLEVLEQKMRLLNDASFIDLSRVALAEMMHVPERAQAMAARLSEKEEAGSPRHRSRVLAISSLESVQRGALLRRGVRPRRQQMLVIPLRRSPLAPA